MSYSKAATFLLCFLSLLGLFFSLLNYDYFEFSLVWPGSNCNNGQCCLPDSANCPALDFHVGRLQKWETGILWPAFPRPLVCPPQCKFYINVMRDMINDLNLHWSDFRCPSSNVFKLWERHWCDYGNCTGLPQPDYFRNALGLRTNISMLSVLRDIGIVPLKNGYYNGDNIKKAVSNHFGFPVTMQCGLDANYPGFSVLQGFKFCASTAFKLMRCPREFRPVPENCSNQVIFFPFRYDMLQGGGKCTDNEMVADE